MKRLAGVFLQVNPLYADGFPGSSDLDQQPSVFGYRQMILGNLVALGQVGVKIIFPAEGRFQVDPGFQSQGQLDGHPDCLPVDDRQAARQAQADRTGEGVRLLSEFSAAATEELSLIHI